MAMSKKDYVAIAAILKDTLIHTEQSAESVERIAREFANYAQEQNPRFDKQRFIEATFTS